MNDQNLNQNSTDDSSAIQNDQNQLNNSIGDETENDAKALIDIADTLEEQADQIEQTVAETSQEYEDAVKEDVAQMDEAIKELEEISHEADLDDAKQDVEEA